MEIKCFESIIWLIVYVCKTSEINHTMHAEGWTLKFPFGVFYEKNEEHPRSVDMHM